MVGIRALLIIASALSLNARAVQNPPDPSSTNSASKLNKDASAGQEKANNDSRGTIAQPAVIELLKAPVIKVEATDKTERHRDYTDNEWWLVYLTAALAATTLGLAIYTAKLYRSTKKMAGDAEKAASNSIGITLATERAYVKLSHLTPGLKIKEGKDFCEVGIEVRNHGRTPATVTDVRVWGKLLSHGTPLPLPFAFPEREPAPSAFLVPGEAFSKTQVMPLHGTDSEDIIQSAKRLWIYGQVDYMDAFGHRYRGGYVRIHEPAFGDGIKIPDRNNLVYPVEGAYAYNFDRARVPGEGNDWGDEHPKL